MRWISLLVCLTSVSFSARAQQQGRTLADRLLRPDTSLVSAEQNKKFTALAGTSFDKEFVAQSFSTSEATSKSFGGTKSFFARIFGTKSFVRAASTANTKSNAGIAANTRFATNESSLIRSSSDSTRKAATRDYADQRPFLAKGTRQEMLSQQQKNKPLTIDEVRELLNTNK